MIPPTSTRPNGLGEGAPKLGVLALPVALLVGGIAGGVRAPDPEGMARDAQEVGRRHPLEVASDCQGATSSSRDSTRGAFDTRVVLGAGTIDVADATYTLEYLLKDSLTIGW